ncbi:zinc-dependent metalloprotease [Tamlana sp. 2_MG-2023]|uniref:zinc-dependent metalloprotease n=1 Tax=unclassified Tamlana TaxID=2614803 RepID=UPI0026E31A04|nr:MULTISPECIES: zinc-dependent metalloprotease [unclassified Tamlana]MDO6759552.1 zinc-dependent metalloprotease [Tamlana sp. 2_MG-2023]MDO6790309.1 zinc-dependent metalloprotease [Tamlana sp. 1_MG-2023]
MSIFIFSSQNAEAQRKNRKNKKDKTETSAESSEKKSKEKSITELTKSSEKSEGLFTIYQDSVNGTIKMLISEDQIGKEFIYFSQISDGVMDAGRINRGSYRGSKVFKIEKYFDKIQFITQNTSFYFNPESPLAKSEGANISHGTMASIKIDSYDKDSGQYLIDVNDLFLDETLSQIKPAARPGQSPTDFKLGKLSKDKSRINAIKNYPENTDVAIEYVYSSPSVLNNGSEAVADGRNVSIKVHHSFIAMPNNTYQPRFDDPRVGYFLTEVNDQTATNSTPYRDLVHRWNLQKKNPELEISEPVEPITWWIENSTPLEWRETIKAGVLKWNVAFEKAGFKNALVVKVQPDDADWDAGDIRYNVLRWTSSPKPPFGGYGPSFVNPKTGQILGADIMLEFVHFTNRVFYDKVYSLAASQQAYDGKAYNYDGDEHHSCAFSDTMHNDFMFANAVASVTGASDLEMEGIKKESMLALIMHEVGHTLGLNHNMKASQLFSPEELANPEFIEGKCLTGSVMDYATLNITKDRSKQGQYSDVAVGPYDIWAIQFGYTPFKTGKERHDLLSQSTKPELTFGNDADDMRSPGKAIDPRVMINDQSNDAITYSVDRIELCNALMKNVKSQFTNTDESYQELRRVYYLLSSQKAGAAGVISRYIGGVYVDRAMAGQEGGTQPYTPVSLDDQKRAMKALNDYVFAPDAFNAPDDLYNYLAMQRRGFNFRTPEDPKIHEQILTYQKNVLTHLLHPNTLQRISDSELYGNEYHLSTEMNDLNDAIFKADISGNVNSFRQNLQLDYTNMLVDMLTGKDRSKFTNNAKSMALYNLKNIRNWATPSGNIASKAHKQHLRTLIDNAIKEIK